MATKPLSIRVPEDLLNRILAFQKTTTQKCGGVEQDYSKVVRHILEKGLDILDREASPEKEMSDD